MALSAKMHWVKTCTTKFPQTSFITEVLLQQELINILPLVKTQSPNEEHLLKATLLILVRNSI